MNLKGMDLEVGDEPLYMYVCIGVSEGVRPGLGGCGRTKRTALDRRRSKGWQGWGGGKGMGLGTSPIPSRLHKPANDRLFAALHVKS
ncbi:hypothetical protein HanIR_Chr10g0461431 [Helianthus annuus]|nr:hypothetical protein HanIR_Chr10g0461431 [Helianthus annuus]